MRPESLQLTSSGAEWDIVRYITNRYKRCLNLILGYESSETEIKTAMWQTKSANSPEDSRMCLYVVNHKLKSTAAAYYPQRGITQWLFNSVYNLGLISVKCPQKESHCGAVDIHSCQFCCQLFKEGLKMSGGFVFSLLLLWFIFPIQLLVLARL